MEVGMLLKTERLLIRPAELSDLDNLHEVFADPRVMEAFELGPLTLEQTEKWLKDKMDQCEKHGFCAFMVFLQSTGEFIGDLTLTIMPEFGEREAELGYDLLSKFWGFGYATEAARALGEYALKEKWIVDLYCTIRPYNDRSKRVAERLGMKRSSEVLHRGKLYDVFRKQIPFA
jgi:ribosomal-protein-alanine N-acetyltransferase